MTNATTIVDQQAAMPPVSSQQIQAAQRNTPDRKDRACQLRLERSIRGIGDLRRRHGRPGIAFKVC